MKSLFKRQEIKKCILLVLAITFTMNVLQGQDKKSHSISGHLKDQTMQNMAYATVALRRSSDSTLITGTSSNNAGEFSLVSIPSGKYCLVISAIGYDLVTIKIDLINDYNTGEIMMKDKSLSLDEVVVVGERMKTMKEADRTTYFINKKMYDASNTGVDLLVNIPGVQVDLMKNISLEGSRNIVILVDGKERDRNYLSQLSSDKIDKIEITNSPDPRFDADVTGVIDIILKKDVESGLSGNIHAEIPSSQSEIYVYPSYSLNYEVKKLNFFTSYNGGLAYFNNYQSSYRDFIGPSGRTAITSEQNLRQKDWSHRFHYGFDFDVNDKNKISFYAFNNPYSNELDGKVDLKVRNADNSEELWSAQKEDRDINLSSYYSANYKHDFDKPGRVVSFDLGYYHFKAENSTSYTAITELPLAVTPGKMNTVRPEQNSVNFKIDYSSTLNEKLKLDAGIKVRTNILKDRLSDDFRYSENIFATYGVLTMNAQRFTFITGLRAEESVTGLTDGSHKNVFSLLPDAVLNFKLASKQSIKLSLNRIVYRPNIYQLNPYTSVDDPYSARCGNPSLKPEYMQSYTIEYSASIDNNYLSVQLYHRKRAEAIDQYVFVNDTGIVETHIGNPGNIFADGLQVTGALKLGKAISINPYIRLSNLHTAVNSYTRQYNIHNRQRIVFESSMSAIASFKHDIVVSLQFQYNSPQLYTQMISFSDLLYFISVEKKIKQDFKIGITCALPFTKKFTYEGSEIKGEDFFSHSEGNIRLSAFPLWFKLTYQFNSGKKSNKTHGSDDGVEVVQKKGF